MKYRTVKFSRGIPNEQGEPVLQVFIYGDNIERVEGITTPNSLGFYHFPVTMSDEEAFEELRAHMIASCQKRIKNLRKEINIYRSLKIDNSHLQ